MITKQIIGGITIALGAGINLYYLREVLCKRVRPHIFTWLIWGLLGLIGSAAQHAGDAGPGAWGMASASFFCLFIAAASFYHGERHITRGDWAAFLFGLAAIPVWMATENPLWAALIVTFVDASAFYPTLRKAWHHPEEESLPAFAVYVVDMALILLAIDKVSFTTAFYPATILAFNALLVFTIFHRRRALSA